MPELDADFEISTNNLEAEYEISEGEHFDCSFEIFAAGATFSNIAGSPYDNEALASALNQKANTSTVEALSETVDSNYNTLDSKIDSTETALENEISALETDLNGKINEEQSARIEADNTLQGNIDTLDGKIDTHIADKTNPHEVTKTQVGLGNVDNTSDLNKPISTATQTALNGKQNTISDLSEIRSNASNGQSAYNTMQNYGDIVTYDASNFATNLQGQKADTALQPNDDISELNNDAGYITSASLPTVNNSTITFQKNNITVGDINLNQPNNETINFDIPTTASDINALPDTTTINDLTTTAQQNAINSGATSDNIGQIATNTSNLNSLQTTVTNNYNTLDGRITSEVSTLNTAIGAETTNRQNADNNLQSQIDAIVSSSDVFDIVGTYAELQAYDISTVPVNDIIKVLVDSTHSNAATYYRCVETGGVKSWLYIGSEGAYYTKSESDSLFVNKTTTVNNKPLSNNITLTASDVGALPSSTTIGNGILTIQNNGVDVGTFGANATSNKTINLVTPTKTSDLTNDSGFIDSSDLSSYATQTDLTDGLATKQDTISDLSTIRSNAANGQSAYTTIQGYGDIVTYNASNFATSAQGSLADTALQQGDDISLLNNDAGYTNNIGTVTSVNGNQPDSSGNVTISVSGGANTDLSNLTPTGEAHFLKNTSSYNYALGILGAANADSAISIGYGSATGQHCIALGKNAMANGSYAIQIGEGINTTSNSLYFGFENNNYQLLDGATGLIPDARISTNIARTSQIPSTSGFEQTSNKVTSITSSSTDTQYPSAKCVYDKLVDVVRQETTDTINLYGWGDSSEQFYTISEPSVVVVGDPVFNSNGTYIGYVSIVNNTNPSLIKIQVIAGTTTSGNLIHNSSLDTTFSRSTLTDNNSNVLNITQADGQWVGLSEGVSVSTSSAEGTRNFSVAAYLPNDSYNYEVILTAYGASSNNSRMSVETSLMPEIYVCGTSSNGRYDVSTFTLPVGTDRIITQKISNSFSSNAKLVLYAYHRIGTNS